MSAHYKSLAKRTNPQDLAIFPLNGALAFPGCDLPLNIFEPRYLNMVDDALKNERLIGMVQNPDNHLAQIGTLARITQFSETDDGRYLIVLRGLKRFKILTELEVATPYRQIIPDFSPFLNDIDAHNSTNLPEALIDKNGSNRAELLSAMKSYAQFLDIEVNWEGLDTIPLSQLIDQAAMISPFKAPDKQSLLEAPDHDERRRLLIGLMTLYSKGPDNDLPLQ